MANEHYSIADSGTRLRSVGHSLALVVAAFLVGIVFSVLVLQFLYLGGVVDTGVEVVNFPPIAFAAMSAAQFVGFFAVVYVYLRRYDDFAMLDISAPSLRDIGWMVGGFVMIYVASTALSILFITFGIENATNTVILAGRENPVTFLYLMVVTVLFVAPAEELLFRGVVQRLFRRAYGTVLAVILASALFGIGHTFALSGSGKLTYLAVAAVLGIILGISYEVSENLAVPIGIHALYNTVLFGVQYLIATGAIQV
jgi:membrane protease YdiL (CAAX protease family)